ncbi:MAG: sodium-dependent bicarbonate transport family permease [Calothrix sp. SM1_5_4]|nr:sodium-dependent bicarbonate transport family permease [Calothrix sp. SM1_5_4]
MSTHLANIDPIILLFALGVIASWVKSDLEIPPAISKFLSIFLLLSIGIKGGHEIRVAQSFDGFLPVLSIGLLSCLAIPTYLFHFLKKRTGHADAAALAACYGSVSAVTFIVAQNSLETENMAASGFMVAVMAMMEIPAIILALALYRQHGRRASI